MSITRQQAQDLANFWRTITPANAAEQTIIDKLTADEDAFIDETTAILSDLATEATVAAQPAGTVTTWTLYSPEQLKAAGRNRRPRISS